MLHLAQAGMLEAKNTLGEGFMTFASVLPGRASHDALRDGWVNVLLLSKADALVAKARCGMLFWLCESWVCAVRVCGRF